jgi:hypothetical protein
LTMGFLSMVSSQTLTRSVRCTLWESAEKEAETRSMGISDNRLSFVLVRFVDLKCLELGR